jgi:hypothetical protein
MFGSAILDVAIGLISVYLILSLIVTSINEAIETVIKLRAQQLATAISKLLGDAKATDFFNHPLIKGLSPNKLFFVGNRRPSYVPSRTFAATVLDLVTAAIATGPRTLQAVRDGINGLPEGDLKKALIVLLEEGKHNLEKLEEQLEVWFNNQMERVSGWYKRKIQVITFAVAVLLTFALNVDSLLLVKTLSNDAALRASLVAQAQELAKQQPGGGADKAAQQGPTKPGERAPTVPDQATDLEKRIKKLEGLGLSVGWTQRTDAGQPGADGSDEDFRQWPGWSVADRAIRERWGKAFVAHFWGWLLTAFAISLGAPFWFDLLNKIVTVRAAGKAPEEKPKPPKEQPKPLGPGETPEEQRATQDARVAALVAKLAPALVATAKDPGTKEGGGQA